MEKIRVCALCDLYTGPLDEGHTSPQDYCITAFENEFCRRLWWQAGKMEQYYISIRESDEENSFRNIIRVCSRCMVDFEKRFVANLKLRDLPLYINWKWYYESTAHLLRARLGAGV